jgi:hypothetical protein
MGISDRLYIISDESQRLKIGVTNNLEGRLRTLQTGNPEQLTIIFEEEIENPTKIERYLHRRFHKNRLKGEWFSNISVEDIRVAIFSMGYFVN